MHYHPTDNCQKLNCEDKTCEDRHPKECKFKEDCRFQTRCSYSHKEHKSYLNKSDEIKTLSEEIDYLKFEITTSKSENDIKINILVKSSIIRIRRTKSHEYRLARKIEY